MNREYHNIDLLYSCVDKVKWEKYDPMRSIIQQLQQQKHHYEYYLNEATKEMIVYPSDQNYRLIYEYFNDKMGQLRSTIDQLEHHYSIQQ